MVIDTSAFVAILQFEPNRHTLLERILLEGGSMAAPNALETHIVLKKLYGERTEDVIREKFGELGIVVVPFTPEHAEEACRAFDRFGKGRHPTALNFGDCVAYALARVSGQSLLFTGEDFSKTDVKPA
jgi:ribonuclease VapC